MGDALAVDHVRLDRHCEGASPGLISTISMPRPLLASSSFHIASAQARARSSGESVALRFTAVARSQPRVDRNRIQIFLPGRAGTVWNKPLFAGRFSRLVMLRSRHAVNDPGRGGPFPKAKPRVFRVDWDYP